MPDRVAPGTTPEESPAPVRAGAIGVDRARLARLAVLSSLLIGWAGDTLLRAEWGINVPLWIIVVAGLAAALLRYRDGHIGTEQATWLLVATAFATALAWRDAGMLLMLNILAVVAALMLARTTAGSDPVPSVIGARVVDLLSGLFRTISDAVVGLARAILVDARFGDIIRSTGNDRIRAAVRAILITVPVVLLFGSLLVNADPVFGSVFALPEWGLRQIFDHARLIGVISWVVGGALCGGLLARQRQNEHLPFSLRLGIVEIGSLLGSLVGLFALFVAFQIGWLFGGEDMVRRTTGLTYAQYARRGFFELVWVAALIGPVILVTRALRPQNDSRALRLHRILSIGLIGLVGVIIASAVARLYMYVRFYSLTEDRVLAFSIMLWIAAVLAWLGLTVLRERPRLFVVGSVVTAYVLVAGLNVANPAARIASLNLSRASREDPRKPAADFNYVAWLGADAVPTVVTALLSPPVSTSDPVRRANELESRCRAISILFHRWGTARRDGTPDWRSSNAARLRARRVVESHDRALREVLCLENGKERAFRDRDVRPRPANGSVYR